MAIGDVTADDACDLARAGVDGLAIVRGIMHADDAKAYCERVIAEFERGAQARAATSQPHAQTQRKHP